MRKIICSVLVFLFAFCTVTTAESVIDISTMTIDELISLRDSIDEQIRGILVSDNTMIYAGDYLVGKDIKAGKYVITCTREKEDADDGMVMAIYDDDEAYKANKGKYPYGVFRDNAKVFIVIDEGASAMISLEEGEHFIISWGEGTCTPANPS